MRELSRSNCKILLREGPDGIASGSSDRRFVLYLIDSGCWGLPWEALEYISPEKGEPWIRSCGPTKHLNHAILKGNLVWTNTGP
jgi:hypothetical protein